MECIDCGIKEGNLKQYSCGFYIRCADEDVVTLTFDKILCADCLTANVYALRGQCEFFDSEDPNSPGNLQLKINNNLVKPPKNFVE
jgi:hypothetical protein